MGDLSKILRKIKKYSEILLYWGIIDLRSGNFSMKLDEENIVVKKTGVGMPFLTKNDVIKVNLRSEDEKVIRKATTDLKIHRRIHLLDRKIKFVLHTHPPEIIALSKRKILKPLDFEGKLFNPVIPVVEYDKVPEVVGKYGIGVIKWHGLITSGGSIEEAFIRTMSAYISAKVLILEKLEK